MNEIIVYDMFRSKWHDALKLALIEKAEELIAKDIHPTTIVDGYRKSADKAIEVLGGAPEAHVAGKLAEWAGTLSGREQLAAQKFSEALEVIPLAENAGMDPIDTITDLRAKQSKGSKWTGVDVRSRKVADISKIEIFEPVIKEQIIKSATEAASMLLRIDDVIAAFSW